MVISNLHTAPSAASIRYATFSECVALKIFPICCREHSCSRRKNVSEVCDCSSWRVWHDHTEPLLDDKQLILIHENHSADSYCNQQQSLNQVIDSEQLKNQRRRTPHDTLVVIRLSIMTIGQPSLGSCISAG